jgi:hypothetical protein
MFNGVPLTFVSGVTLDQLQATPLLDGRTPGSSWSDSRRRNGRVKLSYDLDIVLRRAKERNVQCTD